MLRTFKVIFILFHAFLLIKNSTVTPAQDYNPYIVAHQRNIAMNGGGPNMAQTFTYTSSFTNTVSSASNVYYSTQSIETRVIANKNSNNEYFINYTIILNAVTSTTLTTDIRGHFQGRFFDIFSFRYMLILPGNPWINDYLVIQTVRFNQSDTVKNVSLPSKYASGNSLNTAVMLRDMQFFLHESDVTANTGRFQFGWTTSVSSNFTVSFHISSYANNIGFEFSYLVIVLDSTAMRNDFPRYAFKTRTWTSSGNLYGYSIDYPIDSPFQNYMFGLSEVTVPLIFDPSFRFILQRSSSMYVNCYFNGYYSGYQSYTYSYAVFPYFICDQATHPNYNTTDFLCHPCPQFHYVNSSVQCAPCRFDCLTCYNSNGCATCDPANRYLLHSNNSCLPRNGFYESNTTVPLACDPSCRTCQGNSTFCTSCPIGNNIFMANNTCLACSWLIQGCATCNISYCFSCIANYRLTSTSYCNLNCSDPNCGVCNNSNTSICLFCLNNRMIITDNGQCAGPCGDGLIIGLQFCDDNNNITHDGCTPECSVQPNYNCYLATLPNGDNVTSYCAYTHPIQFQVLSLQKLEYSNTIKIVISLKQYLEEFWKTQAVLNYCFVQSPIPYRNMKASFLNPRRNGVRLVEPITAKYPPGSLMQITFEYLSSIQGQTVNLSFNFSSATDLALVEIPPFQVAIEVIPENNLAAHLYTQQTYKNQKKLMSFYLFLSIIGLLLLILSFFIGGKRIIVEMLMVFQVSFVSLITIPIVTPMFSAVRTLALINNGYNMLAGSSMRPVEDLLSDERVKAMQLYSQVLYNFNTGILFVVIPLISGSIVLILSKICNQNQEKLKKIEKFYKQLLGEYTYVSLMFISCILGAAFVIEIKFGMAQMQSMIGMGSLIFPAALLVLYPIYLIIRFKCPNCFNEYKNSIKDNRFSRVFQTIYFLLGLVLGSLLCAFCRLAYVNCAAAAIPLALSISQFCKPVFKKQIDHYRTQLNLLTLFFAQAPFFYANTVQGLDYSGQRDLTIMMPLFLAVVLFLNFAANFCFFAYLAYKRWRDALLQKQRLLCAQQEEKESVHNEQIEELYKNSLINPLACLKQPKFIDRFIEYSEKDMEESKQPDFVERVEEIPKKNYKRSLTIDANPLPETDVILEKDYVHGKLEKIDQLIDQA